MNYNNNEKQNRFRQVYTDKMRYLQKSFLQILAIETGQRANDRQQRENKDH